MDRNYSCLIQFHLEKFIQLSEGQGLCRFNQVRTNPIEACENRLESIYYYILNLM